ncbi:DUF1566 domain-containing protein [bacterium]|nr:DUF1566 domain-containing protein [bacterium]
MNTKDPESCGTLPANAEWVNGETYIPTWNGSAYTSATVNYAASGDCAFQCKTTYSWIDSSCTCKSDEHVENGVCTLNTKDPESCGTLPANAEWVNGETYIPTWNGEGYTSATANYAESGDCAYKCKATYSWIDSSCTCKSDEHVENGVCTLNTKDPESCGSLPANAEWVNGETYIPTWNGEGYSSATANYAESGDCAFQCKATYTWNGSVCSCTDDQHVENGVCTLNTKDPESCGELPDNAHWVENSMYTPTWNGEEYSSATANYAEDGDCAYQCNDTFEWNGFACGCTNGTHIEEGLCTSDTKEDEPCSDLPENAEWSGSGFYTPTWNGTEYPVIAAHYAASGECAYKCKATYTWNGSVCSCTDSEHVEEGLCASNTKDPESCGTLPANAEWVNGDTYIPTWNGEGYSSATANYAESGECAYKCKETYNWIDSSCTCTDTEHVENGVCTSNTQAAASCGTLPANAYWVGESTYVPTWNGEEYSSATANYADSGDCAFQCNPTYIWVETNGTCACPAEQHVEDGVCKSDTGEAQNCTSLPANATWVAATYTPHWSGEAWSTEPAATYFEDEGEECTYECATDYHYEEGSCQSDTRPAESCGELPENAEWVNGDTYIPTWNGKGYPYATAHYAEEGDCAFICTEDYYWDLDTVTCQPLPYCGDGIIQNAECENIQDYECIAVEGMSEFCDEGELNGTYGHCNNDCTDTLRCGDGILNGDEYCDDGVNNGQYGFCDQLCSECDDEFHVENGHCVSNAGEYVECEGELPENSTWVISTYHRYWDIDNGYWRPSPEPIYSEEEEECSFRCNDGYAWHDDTGECQPSYCGDGILDEDEEACDDGELNGTYGHCNADCTDTLRCGDGLLNGDEECDDGVKNGEYGFCNETCTLCTDDEFHIENGHCRSNAGSFVECEGEIPENSYWVNNTYYTYWTNTGELGSGDGYWYVAEPTYSDEEEECSFRCVENYAWDGEECVETICITENPCTEIENGNGECFSSDLEEYSCGCVDGYVWNGEACELPECSPTSGTPCMDSETALTWSSKSSSNMVWDNANSYCENLTEGGYDDWRLPNIDELRTLIQDCAATEPGGSCGVTESCLSYSCYISDACGSCSSDSTGGHSKFGETSVLWSSSTPSANPDRAWYVVFRNGYVNDGDKSVNTHVRCVREPNSCDSNPCSEVANSDGTCSADQDGGYVCGCLYPHIWNGEECVLRECSSTSGTPCMDSETTLTWSQKITGGLRWEYAGSICENLTEGGYTDWRLPNIDELRTLIQNCAATEPGGTCGVTESCLSYADCWSSGTCNSCSATSSHSIFLDDQGYVWSSSSESDRPDYAWLVDPYLGSVVSYSKSNTAYVRCVRSETQQASCTGLPENADWNSVTSITQKWNGTSWYPSSTGSYGEEASTTECRFKCDDGYVWDGEECVETICATENPCVEIENGNGSCIGTLEGYTCGCDEGYIWNGEECIDDPCDPDPCQGITNSDGTCSADQDGGYSCGCNDGYAWDGEECMETICITENPCTEIENGNGSCFGTLEGYTCGCNDGYFWNGEDCKPLTLGKICTGQTKCYNDDGNEITCPAEGGSYFGQDAQYAALGKCIPQSFTAGTGAQEGTVIDNNTGLVWEQSPSSDTYTRANANNHCAELNSSSYGGINTWRVPNPLELLTIVDNSTYNPATNSNFTNMPTSSSVYFWTSAEYKVNTTSAFAFYPNNGQGVAEPKTETFNVLCVSGDEMQPATSADFTSQTISGSVVVTDSKTGLMWQKEYESKTWQEALDYCKNLEYAGYSDWRLPNKNELASLVNYEKSGSPYSYFPDMPSNYFWSSSTMSNSSSKAWIGSFNYGYVNSTSKTDNRYVRCVR